MTSCGTCSPSFVMRKRSSTRLVTSITAFNLDSGDFGADALALSISVYSLRKDWTIIRTCAFRSAPSLKRT